MSTKRWTTDNRCRGQALRREQDKASMWEAVDTIREKASNLDPQVLQALIEEARTAFWMTRIDEISIESTGE